LRAALVAVAGTLLLPSTGVAQTARLAQIWDGPSRLLHASSQGYLGVLVSDVDSDTAARLKLKEVRGAVVTLIDHDAPAAQVGIRVNDVILQVNGQPVEGAEQFSRMMREIPAGHTVSMVISRDGNTQTIAVELADRKKMEHDVWNKLGNSSEPASSAPGLGILAGSAGDVPAGGFHFPSFGSTLNVGALVEPLTTQMAEYLGVPSGLMIKQVARKSEAETAGLKAFDVILKVGSDPISTSADWDRALRVNQNKPVTVTILRDRKQQTVTLQVDSKRRHSELQDLFPDGNCLLMAALDPEFASQLTGELAGDSTAMQSMRDQAEALRDQFGSMQWSISPEQAEAFRKQMEEQAGKLREEFKDFKLDPKQMDELKKQMRQFQSPAFNQQMREQMKRQMDQLKRQLEEMQAQGFDHPV
jgi:membrane-associated protease RseP (regulator of RpoE activity)